MTGVGVRVLSLKQQQEKDDQLISVEEDLIGFNIRDEGAVGGE